MSTVSSDYTIAEAFQSYLQTNSLRKSVSSQKIDIRTLAIARYFFEQMLGLALMSEVRVEHFERFELWCEQPQKCGDFSKDAWSAASIQRHGKTLKTIFRKAFLTARIERDPTALWKMSPADAFAGRRLMTDEELEQIIMAAADWAKPVFRFLALTGQRPSSVARLKWSDVDEVNGVLYFTSRKGAAKREKRNAFPLTPEISQLFANIQPRIDHVFAKDGLAITGPLISMTAYKLIRRLGFKDLCIYSLRHKFITDLIRSGAPNEVTRRLAGHANESMIKIYSKNLGMESLADAVNSIRGKRHE